MIILMDKKFKNRVDFTFLNRFEKMKLTFDILLDNKQKYIANRILEEINFKHNIEKYQYQNNINFSLKDLLINCGKEEIEGMIYYLSIETKNNNNLNIEEIIYNKISNILPQDIICILPDNNIIKRAYNKNKKYYNLKEYINDYENKKYKISIIYTFNKITNIINGIKNDMSFMISEVKSDYQLKKIIDEIIYKKENNKNEKNYNIVIHFEQHNLEKIQYISNFIINYYRNDNNYKYIFIIHIKRNFGNVKNRIYSILDINPEINQIFIDNLNAPNIKLEDLLDRSINQIIDMKEILNLNSLFKRTLRICINMNLKNVKRNNSNSDINEKILINKDDYIEEIQKYMDEEIDFRQKIFEKVKKLIKEDNSLEGDCKSLIDNLFRINYIDKNSIDIITCLLNYIKEEIISKYLKHILEILEYNNILSNIIEMKKKKLDESKIEEFRDNFLNLITIEKKIYEPKLIFNYKKDDIKKEYISTVEEHIKNEEKPPQSPKDNYSRNNEQDDNSSNSDYDENDSDRE